MAYNINYGKEVVKTDVLGAGQEVDCFLASSTIKTIKLTAASFYCIFVIMKKIGLLLPIIFTLVLGCISTPDVIDPALSKIPPEYEEFVETIPPPVNTSPPVEYVFDPNNISHEKFQNTKMDIQSLVNTLNQLIRAKNYSAWLGYLADPYFRKISSDGFLEERTEELYRRDQMVASSTGKDPKNIQKKKLNSPRDYFDNVVVPSRSNDHVDDIAFISDSNVRAYTIDNRGQRLILYDLEMIDNTWKIVN